MLRITSENYETEVIKSDRPVLVKFSTEHCGPCRMVSKVLEELAKERQDVKIVEVDAEEQQELAQQFKVTAVPLLVIMKDGKEFSRNLGAVPKSKLTEMFALAVVGIEGKAPDAPAA